MKKLFFSSLILFTLAAQAQDNSEIKPAAKGVVYGANISDAGEAISASDVQSKMTNGAFEGKITGKVKEVCKAMGCWITLEKEDGTTLMVKRKDHAFFMPQNLAGRTVVVEGTATSKEVPQEMRRH